MSGQEIEIGDVFKTQIENAALQSQDPLEALYRINPEIATVAYAHKDGLLAWPILPVITRFRELQAHEKIAVVRGLVEKYKVDRISDTAKYVSDNELRGVEVHESSETERTGIVQDGLTERTKITDAGLTTRVEITEQGQTTRAGMAEEGMTARAEITESGLTSRKRIEMQGLIDLQRLEYEARVQILKEHIEGQKYLSDNHLRAIHTEAEAYLIAIQTRESIRAESKRRISKDRLEERIKTGAIDFAKKIFEAETHRITVSHENRAEVIKRYLEAQTELCLAAFKMAAETEDARKEQKRNTHETAREGIQVIREAASNGINEARLIIDVLGERIILDYSAR